MVLLPLWSSWLKNRILPFLCEQPLGYCVLSVVSAVVSLYPRARAANWQADGVVIAAYLGCATMRMALTEPRHRLGSGSGVTRGVPTRTLPPPAHTPLPSGMLKITHPDGHMLVPLVPGL